jgi:hypothetical protein
MRGQNDIVGRIAGRQSPAITTVPRMLLDLAPTSTLKELTRLCHETWVRHDCGPDRIEACIARNPRKPGAAKLRRALGSDVTLSDLDDGFLELLQRHGLPTPRTNLDRHGDKVDCHWPHLDLTIELVSYRYHATATPSNTTSHADDAHTTPPTPTATSSNAARRRSPTCARASKPELRLRGLVVRIRMQRAARRRVHRRDALVPFDLVARVRVAAQNTGDHAVAAGAQRLSRRTPATA